MDFLNYMGGASFIIVIIKIIVDYFVKSDLTKQQEESAKEIELLKDKLGSRAFISNMQYQKEFDIYLELFDKVSKTMAYTSSLMPILDSVPEDEMEAKEMYQRRYKSYVESLNDLKLTRMKYAPFYDEKVNKLILEMIRKSAKQGFYFTEVHFNDHGLSLRGEERMAAYGGIEKEMGKLQDQIELEVRNYLKNLIVFD